MAELKVARSHKGIASPSITVQKTYHQCKLEDKFKLLKVDGQIVQSLIGKNQTLVKTFKQHHYIIADQADEEAVETEKNVLDKNEDKVFSYTSRLHQLLKELDPTDAFVQMNAPGRQ